jgi:predicted O-methyltransferase YrrM
MSRDLWTKVDNYFIDLFDPRDAALKAVLQASEAAGLPPIAVAPNQGKLLMLLAQLQGARAILEIGTLGGYSTIWLARALPAGGRLISLEANAAHAEVARANVARAGFGAMVEVRTGRALDSLPKLAAESGGPFDLIFIDADKTGYPAYWTSALALARPGSLIIADNVARDGAVADAGSTDANVIAVRRMYDIMAADPRVTVTVLQTVGVKGYDGFAVALVNRSP